MTPTPKVAVVTGAGSGVGRAVSLALAADGYAVTLAGRRADALEQTAAQAAAGSRLLSVPTDVTNEVSVRMLFEKTVAAFGRVDLLFNNAGVGAPAVPLDELTLEHWRTVIDVNLTGCFLCAREAIRVMKAQSPRGGRIINNGSISATTPRRNSTAYTASKHAIAGLTKSIALDYREFDIACGQIDIGNADTEMGGKVKHGALQAHGAIVPEPTIDVDSVAQAVLTMANMPAGANVLFLTVMATNMPFVGRG